MTGRPNIVLVVMDSVRAANVSCYGYERPTTPHLDALAARGTLYEQAISVGCWTLPVHASMFTGLFPSSHGLTVSRDALPDGFPTLAERLREAGYATACFSNNPYVSEATGLTQGFDTVASLWRETRPRGTSKPKSTALESRLEGLGAVGAAAKRPLHALLRFRRRVKRWREWTNRADSGAAQTNARILDWLTSAERTPAPSFVFVNYMETHERYRPPFPFNRRFLPPGASRWGVAKLGTKTDILGASKSRREHDLATVAALYDGALAYLDEQVGALVGSLEERGLADDTVVIVTSDHGDSIGEHDHLGHRLSLYEPLVRVPLVIRYPPRFAAGARRGDPVQLGDLFPTILDLAGAASTGGDSDFRSLLDGGEPRAFAVAENTAPKALDSVQMRMVRGERFKYIWKSNGRHELYDLAADPAESENLVEARADLAASLAGELDAWTRSLEGKQIDTREAEYDEETLRRLQGLGYVG